MEKINILLIPSDTTGGVFYYRTFNWYNRMIQDYEDINIIIPDKIDFNNKEWLLENNIHIIYFHNGIFRDDAQILFWNYIDFAKEHGIKLVLDLDDWPDWGVQHLLYQFNRENKIAEKILVNIYKVDYITTTTEYFKNKLEKVTGKNNIYVFRNCIDIQSPQFEINKKPSERLRLGISGGISHGKDYNQIYSILRKLPKQYLDKIQLVLVGWNTNGTISFWPEVENKFTINKTICSKEYRDYLNECKTDEDSEPDISNEIYRRITVKKIYNQETKSEGNYGLTYNNFDILLAPLTSSEFNNFKSELKFVEAGFTGTGIIYSEIGPYRNVVNDHPNLKDLTIGVNLTTGVGGWVKAIKWAVDNREKMMEMNKKFSDFIIEEYDIKKENKKRYDFLKSIL